MLEMAKYLEPEEAEKYTALAEKLIKALCDHCAVKDHSESNGLLLHGTYARASKGNPCTNRGWMSAIPGEIISSWKPSPV